MARSPIGTHRTKVYRQDDGSIEVFYHDTCVFQYNASHSTVRLCAGGWYTATTKKRMNQCFQSLSLPFRVTQTKGEWSVRNYREDTSVKYIESMHIPV